MNIQSKLISASALILQLVGCAALISDSVSRQDFIGKNVDEAMRSLQNKGYSCGLQQTEHALDTNELVGAVACDIKESSLFCPKSYEVFLGFDLDTHKVHSFGKRDRDNCF